MDKDIFKGGHRVERAAQRLTDPDYKKRELRRAITVSKWIWLVGLIVLCYAGPPVATLLAAALAIGFSVGQWVGGRTK